MDDQTQVELDKQKAEIFDALGHPTRILILKVLSEGSLGFADLKKKTAIESSGHLQHHLSKLDGLVKTDEYGKYCLSDEGKDALLTVQTVENVSPKKEVKTNGHRRFRIGLKPVAFLLLALLIASSAVSAYEYNQAADNHAALLREKATNADEIAGAYIDKSNVLHIILTNNETAKAINNYLYIAQYDKDIVIEIAKFPLSRLYAVQDALDGVMIKFSIDATSVNQKINRLDINLHDSTKKDILDFLNNQFNDFDERCISFLGPLEIVPSADLTTNTNSSFAPPISMYQAIQLALERFGLNETSVSGKTIHAQLELWQTTTNGTFISQSQLTNIPSDYSSVTENGIIHRYVWVISITNPQAGGTMLSLIDASIENLPPISFH